MIEFNQEVVDKLARRAIDLSRGSTSEIDRFCWILLHEYIHGFRPSEYDIREIEEEKYLELLERVKEFEGH
tara:strand:- start:2311 stop:2523 length:213 start_codon:yes stop_codon:yes gene_type:complete